MQRDTCEEQQFEQQSFEEPCGYICIKMIQIVIIHISLIQGMTTHYQSDPSLIDNN